MQSFSRHRQLFYSQRCNNDIDLIAECAAMLVTAVSFLNDFKKKVVISSRCLYLCMYVIRIMFAANFSVTAESILVKLIAFCLASINLIHGERIIKIG